MCAIVDANVVGELWDGSSSAAGQGFRQWVEGPNGQLVLGGKLRRELGAATTARWLRELDRASKLTSIDDLQVDQLAASLESLPDSDPGSCKSDDHHVIALAQISGARMLYSNDQALQRDFKNTALIDQPRGTVYSTLQSKAFNSNRRAQLRRHRCRPESMR